MRSLNIAATGMQAQQTNVDVISHNLANMTTTGYKLQRAEFQDLIYQDLRRVGTNSADVGTIVPTGVQLGLGTKTAAIYRQMSQGTLQLTDNALDLAINGRGYFVIQLPDGTQGFTRNGTFQLSPQGELVTSDGFIVSPNITIPQDAISISVNQNGEVQVETQGQVEPQIVGQLEISTFINEGGLRAIGDNLYLETAASGPPFQGIAGQEGFGVVLQGYLENSNVNPVSEITNLIVAQRAYEMNSKVITASDEMLQALNQSA
jgi:flagellar basal-body rod protein FlgG